jgi:hypothetical protein
MPPNIIAPKPWSLILMLVRPSIPVFHGCIPSSVGVRPKRPLTMIGAFPSPRNRFVFPARERPRQTVRAEPCNTHRLAGALFDGLGARISIEVRLGKPGETALTLIPSGSNSIAMATVKALSAVLDAG